MSKPLNQSGDTIVELMMAILVLGTVLMGAFLLSQRSASSVQNSQEQAEMNQALNTQVELVRSMALGQRRDIYLTGKTFCIDKSSNPLEVVEFSSGFDMATANMSSFPTECLEGRYGTAITYNQDSGIFTFNGKWDRLGGGFSTSSFKYRIDQ